MEIDAVIANRRNRNVTRDIDSYIVTAFPSDHFPVIIRVKMKLAKNHKVNDESSMWKSPISEATNTEIHRISENGNFTDKERPDRKVEILGKAMKSVAEEHVAKNYPKKQRHRQIDKN